MRIVLKIVGLWLLLLLSACQTELYSDLTETEANEVLAALLAVELDASKEPLGDERYSVSVGKDEVLRALDVLKDQGLPRQSRESLGKVFAKSGIVSSPFEERIRYIYALGEDVAQTLQQIDGVLTARVHIVLPEAPELGQELKPSSAAVFIKQRPNVDLDFLIPQIRRLVSNSIEGVNYDDVTVVLVEARRQSTLIAKPDIDLREVVPGLQVVEASMGTFWQWVMVAFGLLLLSLVINVVLLVLNLRKPKTVPATEPDIEDI